MAFATKMKEMQTAGLLDFSSDVPHLTEKGRDYLRILDDAGTQEIADAGEEDQVDFVLSTNAVWR
ncbi:MAG: hypothetical protein ACRDJL_06230 [Actinomycetota bacterium]